LLVNPGRLLVADSGNGRILSVNTASGAATTIASGLTTPLGMTFGEAGDLIVGEHDTGRLIRVRPDGSKSVLAGGLSKPYSVVTARDGNYYVAEVGELAFPSGALRRVSPAGQVSTVRLRT
jgi:sugar lactone lactonase YvrE